MSSSTRNPLRTFTRDQVVAKIKTETIYRRFYIQVVNKTWIQVPQDYILRYLAVPVRDEVEYTLDAIHEKNVGYGLYIVPLDADAEVVPEVKTTPGIPLRDAQTDGAADMAEQAAKERREQIVHNTGANREYNPIPNETCIG